MAMNPNMMEMVVASRVAELQRVAKRSSAVRISGDGGSAVVRSTSVRIATEIPGAARRSVGWFLVSVGMRLVVSGRRPMSAV
jgi:hypothetical protein